MIIDTGANLANELVDRQEMKLELVRQVKGAAALALAGDVVGNYLDHKFTTVEPIARVHRTSPGP